MGLINFLKQKFSRWKEEKEKEKEKVEEKGEQTAEEENTSPSASAPAEFSSPEKEEELPKEEPLSQLEEIGKEKESIEEERLPVEEKKEGNPIPEKEEETSSLPSVKEEALETPEKEEKPLPETKEEVKPLPEKKEEISLPSPSKKVEEETKESKGKESESQVIDKYITGLDKSRTGFTDRMRKLAARNKIVNQDYFDQLERILIEADVGVDLSLELIRETAAEAALQKIDDPQQLNDLLIDKMFIGYANEGGSFKTDLEMAKEGPTVVFMCGVNGGGKTTTTAKLAKKYKDRGKKVLLVAADTFRAGAVEQLTYWAEKVGVDILSRPLADPASLCFDALKKAKNENYDLVFVDTAGRLQNKKALMDELSKVVRVMKKVIPEAPHESLLVIDANTGQNGIDQAQVFKESVPLTGIVITKMDGTSKGGILLAIRKQLSLPVRFIGLGEKMDDLEEFDLDKYLYGLLIGNEEE